MPHGSSASAVRRFRTLTSHSPGRPAGGGPFDPANRPDTVKRYTGGDVLELPVEWAEASMSMGAALSGVRAREPEPMGLTELARLLFLTGGVTRRWERGGRSGNFRAAPSAGALYPIEVYVVSGALPDLSAGVHHHDPVAGTLRVLREGEMRDHVSAAAGHPGTADSPVSLVFTGIPWRTTWKYGPRGYRHLFWDAGSMIANTLVAAASVGWHASVAAGFVDGMIGDLLSLDEQPFRELPVAVVRLDGQVDDDTPVDPSDLPGTSQLSALPFGVEPLSPDVRRYEEIAEVHDAVAFETVEDVIAWRTERPPGVFPEASTAGDVPEAAAGSVDEVVLRRGSTRRFDPSAVVPAAWMRWAMSVALGDVVGDVAPSGRLPIEGAVAAHAVDGIPPGLHRVAHDGWERVGDQDRRQTAHQCLDQGLGGTSIATAFWGCDLDRLLDAAGPRAYTAAELTAGIAAERLQLAAFALGLGGTGLTFYDDEVRRATGSDPLLVTAVGEPDYEPVPGRRPRPGDR